jgi:VWFA-related protein
VLVGVWLAVVRGQTPPDPASDQPVFRAKADLVAVDASVVDGKGQPVRDLQPEEFTLEVDGKPRRLVSVEYVDRSVPGTSPEATEESQFTSNQGAVTGRLIVLVVDQGHIRWGSGRLVLDSASRFLDRLSPADRVAVAVIPGPGPTVDFTGNREAIRAALKNVVGTQRHFEGFFNLSLTEARAYELRDPFIWPGVVERECLAADMTCPEQLGAEALTQLSEMRVQTRASLRALERLITSLGQIEAPKTMVFISEGIILEDDSTLVSWLARATAAARVSIYALHLDASAFDASSERPGLMIGADALMATNGLELLTGFARGTLFKVSTGGGFAFDRIASEISGYYLLSFEPEPSERDGKTHKIEVDVGRKGVTLRARREFTISESATAASSQEERLGRLLTAPFPETEIALKVATFTLRDMNSPKLRVVISAKIDPGPQPDPTMMIGYVLIDESGLATSDSYHRVTMTAVEGREVRERPYVGSVLVDPGTYTLRLAAVEPSGRSGSVQHTVQAKLAEMGNLRIGDLILSEELPPPGESPRPTFELEADVETLSTYVEVYGAKPEDLKDAAVKLEVAQNEKGPALVNGKVQLAGRDDRRAARSVVSIGLLPPGDYVARAVVSRGSRKVGHVVRPFSIPVRRNASVAVGGGPRAGTAALTSLTGDAGFDFRKEAVLDASVVGTFLDRLQSRLGASMSPEVTAAFDQAQAGRFDAVPQEIDGGEEGRLATAFLQGLKLLSAGDLENAAGNFRAALSVESDFFPALFYLGVCYAAGGRDREASAAWQTSLISESDSPVIYKVLSESLLRLNDTDQAVAVLREAIDVWPDNTDFTRRLAHVYASTDQTPEAMEILTALLEAQPADQDALFLAIRLIYEAHSKGRPVDGGDRERLERYAQQYASANGPQQDLVARWVKFVEEKK